MAGKKKGEVIVAPSTGIVDIRAELAKEAAAIKDRIGAATGDSIRTTQDKKFILPDGTKTDRIAGVILDFVSSNQFFDRPFKKGEESPPACFAIGPNPKGLVPSKNSPDLQLNTGQKTCDECVNNEWGSNGAGKACSNLRLLALVEDSPDPDAPIRVLKVSPTATKAFDAYVNILKATFDTVPVGVVTEIYFDPDQTYGSLRFGNPTPNTNLEVHFKRRKAAMERLLQEPDVSQYTPPGKKAAKKK